MSAQDKKEKAIEQGLCWLKDLAVKKRGEAIRVLEHHERKEVLELCDVIDTATDITGKLAHRLLHIIDDITNPQQEAFPDEEREYRMQDTKESTDQLSLLNTKLDDTENSGSAANNNMDKPKTKTTPASAPVKKTKTKTKTKTK